MFFTIKLFFFLISHLLAAEITVQNFILYLIYIVLFSKNAIKERIQNEILHVLSNCITT